MKKRVNKYDSKNKMGASLIQMEIMSDENKNNFMSILRSIPKVGDLKAFAIVNKYEVCHKLI